MFKEFIPSSEYPDDPELRRELYKKDKLFLQEHEGIMLPVTSIKKDFLKAVQELHLADKIQIVSKKVRAYEVSKEYQTDQSIINTVKPESAQKTVEEKTPKNKYPYADRQPIPIDESKIIKFRIPSPGLLGFITNKIKRPESFMTQFIRNAERSIKKDKQAILHVDDLKKVLWFFKKDEAKLFKCNPRGVHRI